AISRRCVRLGVGPSRARARPPGEGTPDSERGPPHLRPGEFLFAVSPNIHHPQARDDPDHINLFTPHQLAVEARAAGYTRVELGTNFWRHFWEPKIHLGQVGAVLAGVLWKLAPIDRLAGSASVLAWK